jgi:hypothetical protein
MPSYEEIKKQIAALPDRYVFWTQKEIRALPKILVEGERILALTSGFMNKSTWLLVCTDSRLIFLNRGMFFGLRQIQIPLERVQSIDHSFVLVFGNISVWDGASSVGIGMVLKSSIMPFVRATEEAMSAIKRQGKRSASTPTHDIASQLERLAALRDRGVLTLEEFEQQKRKILG